MNKYKQLEQKIRSMSAKEIVLAMLDGIKNPVTRIDMDTFGEVEDEVCYGCAATNLICKLGDFSPLEELSSLGARKYSATAFLQAFEESIDLLRMGALHLYNINAREFVFAEIPESNHYLPEINNDNFQDPEVLEEWYKFANTL